MAPVGIFRRVPPEISPNRFLPAISEINVKEIKRIGRGLIKTRSDLGLLSESIKSASSFIGSVITEVGALSVRRKTKSRKFSNGRMI